MQIPIQERYVIKQKTQIFTQVSALRINQGYTSHVNMGV